MTRILLAGATGTLGRAIVRQLVHSGQPARLIVRRPEALPNGLPDTVEVVTAEVTRPETLAGVMDGVGGVLTTVGITRQRDGLSYDDVDYGANANLLNAALDAGVPRFAYVSVFGGRQMRDVAICDAKERFVDELQGAPIESVVIRPTGFFTDLDAFLDMAQRGRAWVFGDGQLRLNPVHPDDLARVCLRALDGETSDVEVGGPDVLTHEAIARLAFEALGRAPRVTHIPDVVRRTALATVRWLPFSWVGPAEFFLASMGHSLVAPQHGTRSLGAYFRERAKPPRKLRTRRSLAPPQAV
ncbi:MAG: SDR family oxidoreductase [Rubricoccaceae bacterium]